MSVAPLSVAPRPLAPLAVEPVPPPAGPSPADSAVLVSDDVEQLYAVLVEYFAPHSFRVLERPPARGRLQVCHQGQVSLYSVAYGADAQVGPDELPDDFYMVTVPLAGDSLVMVGRDEALTAPSVISPGQQFLMRKTPQTDTLVVRIGRAVVDKAVRDVLGEEPSTPVRFAGVVEARSAQAQQWLALARACVGTDGGGLLARSPLAAGHFEQLLVHGLLGFQPHNRSEALTGPLRPVTPMAVRRAMSFCEEHADQPISIRDIAAAARVSARTLQDHFRTHAQTTPLGYLRRVRLERAHRDLLAAAESGAQVTVTDIALRWGFVHLSRFAQLYRDAFGHLPSESLSAERGTRSAFSG